MPVLKEESDLARVASQLRCTSDRQGRVGAPHSEGPRYDGLRAAQVRAVGTAFLRRRPLLVGCGMALTLALLFAADVPGAQLGLLSVGFSAMLALFGHEAWLGRRRQLGERRLFVSLLVTTLGIGFGCLATGALRSPLVALLFAPVVTTFAAFGRGRRTGAALVAVALVIGGLALVPRGVPFAPIPAPFDALLTALACALSLTLLYLSVCGLTDAYRRAGHGIDALRAEVFAESERRLRSLEAVGARVAHEIKNPLSSIKGLATLVARGGAEHARSARRLEVLQSEVERIEAILEDYLNFSRPLAELELAEVELGSLLGALAELVTPRAEAAGVRVALELPGEPVRVRADAAQLRGALLNLVGNAIEASAPGGAVVLALEALGHARGARLVVRDQGRGMSPAQLARLGQPFVSGREGGTGLGVVLARTVALAHGGRLEHDSEPQRGTRATLTLPCYPGGAPAQAHEAPADALTTVR